MSKLRDLEPQEYLPRPWLDTETARLHRDLSNIVTENMLADGEDPADTALYRLRRQQLMIALEECMK